MKRLTGSFVSQRRFGPRPAARRRIVVIAALAGGLAGLAGPASAQRLQEVTNPLVRQAIEAYDAGELARALQLLESAPASLPAAEAAVRALYAGLVHVARGDPLLAREAFVLAVRLDPTAALDPELHAPTRVAAFEASRDLVVAEWRSQAEEAEAAGDTAAAKRFWASVVAALPGDAAAQGRIDAIESAEREAEAARQAAAAAAAAEDSLRQRFAAQRDTATTPPAVAMPDPDSAATVPDLRRYSPGQAFTLGLVVPGLGQMYAGRGALGLLTLAAAGGIAVPGILSERVAIDCRVQPVDGTCPPGDILDERTERPYLVAGLAGAAIVTLVGAFDAYYAARRANVRAARLQGGGTGTRLEVRPAVQVDAREIRVQWARIRF